MLEDREYMRDPAAGAGGPLVRAWVWLLAINLLVFIVWTLGGAALDPWMSANFMVSGPGLLEQGRVWTLFTSAFSHVGLWHLFWNMVFLAIFASQLEVVYGPRNMVALYLFGACAASTAWVATALLWGDPRVPMLGASGAVLAVVAATTLFFPTRRLHIWGVLPVPLWALASAYLLLDLLGVLASLQGGQSRVAHTAHLGGAAAGCLFKLLDLRPFGAAGLHLGAGWPRARRGSVPLDDRIGPPPPPLPRLDPALAARVDELLRKISQEGMEALSPEERAILEEASEELRKIAAS